MKSLLLSIALSGGLPRTISFSPSNMQQRHPFLNTLSSSVHQHKSHDKYTDIFVLLACKVGIFFGTSTGSTEGVADLIKSEFGSDANGPFEIDDVQGSIAKMFSEYDALVVGTPTWNTGADSQRSGTGWDEVYYDEMQDLNISGKKVAVFGLGDQISYCENYADASGELHDIFEGLGCQMMGYTSQEGYEHEESKAARGNKFCGLLCDEVNQDDLTEERVKSWVAQLKAEGMLEVDASATTTGDTGNTTPQIDDDVVEEVIPRPLHVDQGPSTLAGLEAENSRLRKMLEDSNMMDSVLRVVEVMDESYTSHYNSQTRLTMWTSPDGKKCYYTKNPPKNP